MMFMDGNIYENAHHITTNIIDITQLQIYA